MILLKWFLVACTVVCTKAYDDQVKRYLVENGYLRDNPSNGPEDFFNALKDLQRFYRVPVTGILDEATRNLIETPRCGIPDIEKTHAFFVPSILKWEKPLLTYKLANTGTGMDKALVEWTIRKAFTVWSDVTNLEFQETTGSSDLVLGFYSGSHHIKANVPHCNKFDGKGRVYGHASQPGGYVHFDDEEDWSFDNKDTCQSYLPHVFGNGAYCCKPAIVKLGTVCDRSAFTKESACCANDYKEECRTSHCVDFTGPQLLRVAVHEIGHALGLLHTDEKDAIMFAQTTGIYKGLHKDDINAIQNKYGELFLSNGYAWRKYYGKQKGYGCHHKYCWKYCGASWVFGEWCYSKSSTLESKPCSTSLDCIYHVDMCTGACTL